MYNQETIDRFWSSVHKSETGCWVLGTARYGDPLQSNYRFFNLPDGRTRASHRIAYELTYGSIPAGMVIRHRCAYRGCCNPEHLLLGTFTENAWDDQVRRERNIPRGVLLTYEDVPGWLPKKLRKQAV